MNDDKSNARTAGVTGHLREKIAEAVAIYKEALASDIDAKYRIAKIVCQLRDDPEKYGKRGVEELAATLGLDKSSLYKDARVPECWTLKRIQELTRQAKKRPLTWSHLLALSALAEGRRKKLTDVTVATKISARELSDRVKGHRQPATQGEDSDVAPARAEVPLIGRTHKTSGSGQTSTQLSLRRGVSRLRATLESLSAETRPLTDETLAPLVTMRLEDHDAEQRADLEVVLVLLERQAQWTKAGVDVVRGALQPRGVRAPLASVKPKGPTENTKAG